MSKSGKEDLKFLAAIGSVMSLVAAGVPYLTYLIVMAWG